MADKDEKTRLFDKLKDWFNTADKDDKPVKPEEQVSYVRAWLLLRKIDIKELWPVIFSVPLLVFFAISGFIAWLVLFARFVVGLWSLLS